MANGKKKFIPKICSDCEEPIVRDPETGCKVCGCDPYGDEDSHMKQEYDPFSQYCNYRELNFDE